MYYFIGVVGMAVVILICIVLKRRKSVSHLENNGNVQPGFEDVTAVCCVGDSELSDQICAIIRERGIFVTIECPSAINFIMVHEKDVQIVKEIIATDLRLQGKQICYQLVKPSWFGRLFRKLTD